MTDKIGSTTTQQTPRVDDTHLEADHVSAVDDAQRTEQQREGAQRDAEGAAFNFHSLESKMHKKSFGDTKGIFDETPGGKPGPLGKVLSKLPQFDTKDRNFEIAGATLKGAEGSFKATGIQAAGRATIAEVVADGSGRLAVKDGSLKAQATVNVGVTAVDVAAQVSIGSKTVGITASGGAFVGAKGTLTGTVVIDPKNNVYAAKVGGEAFVGARAGGEGTIKAGKYGSATVGGEALAGVGGAAKFEAGIKNGRIKMSVELGLAAAVGLKGHANFDIDARAMASDAKKGVVSAAVEAEKAITDAAKGSFATIKGWAGAGLTAGTAAVADVKEKGVVNSAMLAGKTVANAVNSVDAGPSFAQAKAALGEQTRRLGIAG